MEIRNKTIPYCINNKRESLKLKKSLNKRFTELCHIFQADAYDENTQTKYQSTKNEQIKRQKARGVIIRSKCKWAEEWEKSRAYFLRLEKHNFCNKLVTQMEVDGKTIKEPKTSLMEKKHILNNYIQKVG